MVKSKKNYDKINLELQENFMKKKTKPKSYKPKIIMFKKSTDFKIINIIEAVGTSMEEKTTTPKNNAKEVENINLLDENLISKNYKKIKEGLKPRLHQK